MWRYDEYEGLIYGDDSDYALAAVSDSKVGRLMAAAPYMYHLLEECLKDDIDQDLEGDIMALMRDLREGLSVKGHRSKKQKEALARMEMLGIGSTIIRAFDRLDSSRIYDTEEHRYLPLDREEEKRVSAFEQENNALVYFIIRSYTSLGVMDNYLFVSDHPQEWEQDRQDIKNMEVMAYVYNRDDPELSEFGYIGVKKALNFGLIGLNRVW